MKKASNLMIADKFPLDYKGGLYMKPPKFEHIFVAVITFFSLSSVQIPLIPTCCLLCVL